MRRKLHQELGITTLSDPKFFNLRERIIYRAQWNHQWGEHELDHIYTVAKEFGPDDQLAINADEVNAVQWLTRSELGEAIEERPDEFTPWFKLIFKEFLSSNCWSRFLYSEPSARPIVDYGLVS